MINSRCEFTGSLIVVPDVSALNLPGAAAETSGNRRNDKGEGLKGLKALGVRDLNYRMAFLACSVTADGKLHINFVVLKSRHSLVLNRTRTSKT